MSWQEILRTNITSWERLSALIETEVPKNKKHRFPLNLPLRLANKIEKGNTRDPLFIQFVPQEQELQLNPDFLLDPVGDKEASCSTKGLKKYEQRILLLTTQACAMHCRYCFRQNFDYAKERGFSEELRYIEEDATLREVILSGGDPLSLSDRTLSDLIGRLGKIAHLKRLRFHTRFPIGIPERITPSFLQILADCPLQTWFVIHCNHAKELDDTVLAALKLVQKLGIPVLNQAVLLKGVNDSIEALQALCETLVDNGIQPYYLHQLDRVQGGSHFEVDRQKGCDLIEELRGRLAGYGVPVYVKENAGEMSKTPILNG